jgi:hypothetical protein
VSNLKFVFPTTFARKVPDPVFGKSHNIMRHILFVPVRAVPKGLPLDPNARIPDISRRIYRDIEDSLLNRNSYTAGTFHLKHKGITVIADRVEQKGENQYVVTIEEGQGIVDGGHTYSLMTRDREDPDELPAEQFVKFEILTHLPSDWIAEIAGGLNTSVQVQPMSLDSLAGEFDWIKTELEKEPYFKQIAWKENEPGEFDARDLVSMLTCFNIEIFPNEKDEQPVVAYEKKSAALQLYEKQRKSYERLKPILKDILSLHDTIRFESRDVWNKESGGKFGNLAFVETRKKGFQLPFIRKTAEHRLMNGALYPMLASFRWKVEADPKGNFRWKGGFDSVLQLWKASASELMRMTNQASLELGRNPNAIGKSRSHWANLHTRVAMRDLMTKQEERSRK